MSFARYSDPDYSKMTPEEITQNNKDYLEFNKKIRKEKEEQDKEMLEKDILNYYVELENVKKETEQQKLKEELEYLQRNKNNLPRCFDPLYYLNKANSAKLTADVEYYKTLQRYINKGREFYTYCVYKFAKNHNNIDNMPDYIKEYNAEGKNINEIISQFVKLEKTMKSLIEHKNGGKVETYVKNHVRINEFTNLTAQAYLMVYDFSNNNYLKDLNKMQNAYETADLKDEDLITKFKAAQIRVKYKVDKNFYDCIDAEKIKTVGAVTDFYKNISTKELYFDMLDHLKVFSSKNVGIELQNKLTQISKPVNKELINIFINYKDILYCIHQLNYILQEQAYDYKDKNNLNNEKTDRDLYKTVSSYYNQCEFILNNVENQKLFKRALKDISDIKDVLSKTIKQHKDFHQEYIAKQNKSIQEFLNSDLAKNLNIKEEDIQTF